MKRIPGSPLSPPLVPASTFFTPGDPHQSPFVYGRYGNPTWSALEAEQERMCGAPSLALGSGMAACALVLDALVPRGATIVAPSDCYYTVRTLIKLRGLSCRFVSSAEPGAFAEAAAGAALVWIETPTNPGLDIVDIAATARACRAAGALLVVDNTLATARGQDPLALGADVVALSATKSTSGHHDALVGLVSTKDPERLAQLRQLRTVAGMIPGTLESWLCLRGMKTLDLRLARSSASALAVAGALSRYDVRYPGLPTHPAHALARRQMSHFGPVLTFDLGSEARAATFCGRLESIAEATSFGGADTTLERRARWGGDDISPGLIRLSVGLEEPDAIIGELERALSGL